MGNMVVLREGGVSNETRMANPTDREFGVNGNDLESANGACRQDDGEQCWIFRAADSTRQSDEQANLVL